MRKVALIGIDGATYNLFGPLIDEGWLPNLRRLRDRGVWGELDSSLPPVTATAWGSVITGKSPAKHGLLDFMARRDGSYTEYPVSARNRRGKTIWELLSEQGRRVMVLNVPATYPVSQVDGVMVSGFLTPRASRDFVHPPEMLEAIEKDVGPYVLWPKHVTVGSRYSKVAIETLLGDLEEMLDYKRRVAHYLLDREQVDFLMYHIWGTDIMQHQMWSVLDPSHRDHRPHLWAAYGDRIRNYWRSVDAVVGELSERMGGDDAATFVVSDHGFGATRSNVYLAAWLEQQGYLTFKRDGMSRLRLALYRAGFTPAAMLHAFTRLMLRIDRGWSFQSPEPQRVFGAFWRRRPRLFLSTQDIDWSKTRAFCKTGLGQIVINVRGREPNGIVEPGEEYEALRREIGERLCEEVDPATGLRIVDRVLPREARGTGPFSRDMADLFVPPGDNGYIPTHPSNIFFTHKMLFEMPGARCDQADHRMQGIFHAAGPDIASGRRIEGARLEDVAPTILHWMGLPVPEDMDGTVLASALSDEFLAGHAVQTSEAAETDAGPGGEMSADEEAELVEKLKQLGYLS